MTIHLPPRPTEVGAETRLLMAECKGPSFTGFNQALANNCMEHMDLVLWDRLSNNPAQFLAPGAKTIIDIIKAKGQFHGFEHYPTLSAGMVQNLQDMVDIANKNKDPRQSDFVNFINAAINVSNAPIITDPSPDPHFLAAWRTSGSSSPGPRFTLLKTILGIDFYHL